MLMTCVTLPVLLGGIVLPEGERSWSWNAWGRERRREEGKEEKRKEERRDGRDSEGEERKEIGRS